MAISYCRSAADEQGRELVVHGTAAFPIGCYHDDLAKDPVPWHWHDELEAVVVSEGEVLFGAGAEKHLLKTGDGIFINAGILHYCIEASSDSCRLHSICFHPRLVGGSLDSVFWQNYLQPLLSDTTFSCIRLDQQTDWQKDALDAIEEAWQSCAAEQPGFEFQVRSALSRLIWILTSQRQPTESVPREKDLRDAERIKMMLQYIHDHYSEDIHTALIAQSALISCSECLRCFRGTIGTTPIQYLKQYRISQAARLLISTQLKITDIGTCCGFQEMSYFARAFRELTGVTPSEYRKTHKQQLIK